MENMWNLTVDELFDIAEKNTRILFPDKLEQLWKILFTNKMGLNEIEKEEIHRISSDEMYILTNTDGINGATAMLYSSQLHELAVRLDSNLYILPSSVHEVIVVPANDRFDPFNLMELVKEVNKTVVLPEEILADNVYYYKRDNKRIMSCI